MNAGAVIRVSRRFAAPADRVFDAWTDPETARRWLFSTPTGEIVRAETDPRVGGTFVFVDRREGDAGKEDIEHVGEYLEVDRPRRLVFTFAVPRYAKEFTIVAVDIVPVGTGCELTLTHEGVLREWASKTEEGWTTLLAALERTLGAGQER